MDAPVDAGCGTGGILHDPAVHFMVLRDGSGEPLGFYELDLRQGGDANLAYFGLLSRGWGAVWGVRFWIMRWPGPSGPEAGVCGSIPARWIIPMRCRITGGQALNSGTSCRKAGMFPTNMCRKG